MRRDAMAIVQQLDFFLSRPTVYGEYRRTFYFTGGAALRVVKTSDRCHRRHNREREADHG